MTEAVLLAGCSEWPLEPDGHLLIDAFAARGVLARPVLWDDPTVDWSSGLVSARSTWDYTLRLPEFLGWARSLPRLLNGAAVFAWNADKAYLAELHDAGHPVVPSFVAEDGPGRLELARQVGRFDQAVVKPRVGAGGQGVSVVAPGDDLATVEGDGWIVQPLVESVRTEGETSVFVLGGLAVSQVRKLPTGGEIRVHEQFGGTTVPAELTSESAALAIRIVEAVSERHERDLPYARVDMLRLADGTLVASEVELIEPGLYLDVLPANADAFAEVVVGLL